MNINELSAIFLATPGFTLQEVVIQALTLIVLSVSLSTLYVFRGQSLSNRARLASLLPLMALTTMLIISIVKSSLALSLGLVGALSIVRFRAAIKDPEELAYIFLAISLGLGFGAEQVAMTTIFFIIIAGFILVQSAVRGKLGRWFTDKDSLHLEITFHTPQSLTEVTQILAAHTSKIKLTRMDNATDQVMMFLIKPNSEQALEALSTQLHKLDPKMKLTVLQYQPLV